MSGKGGPDAVHTAGGGRGPYKETGADAENRFVGAGALNPENRQGEIVCVNAANGPTGPEKAGVENEPCTAPAENRSVGPAAMSPRAQRAYALFLQGYNCAQSVAGAFADEMGLPLETVMRMASGFGGGIGRLRETCGTVSGMVLAAGMLRGYGAPETGEKKTQTYAMIQELAARFRAANGSIVCRELLGLAAPEGTPQAEARTPEYYRKRPCPRLAAEAAGILEAYLAETAGEK